MNPYNQNKEKGFKKYLKSASKYIWFPITGMSVLIHIACQRPPNPYSKRKFLIGSAILATSLLYNSYCNINTKKSFENINGKKETNIIKYESQLKHKNLEDFVNNRINIQYFKKIR